MENKNEKKLYFDSIIINLNSVDFKKMSDTNENVESFKIIVKDLYEISSISDHDFNICYERKIELEPKKLFTISVKFDLVFVLSGKTKKMYQDKREELVELIKEKAEKALQLTNVTSRASSLISSISMQLNCNPIITPPTLLRTNP